MIEIHRLKEKQKVKATFDKDSKETNTNQSIVL